MSNFLCRPNKSHPHTHPLLLHNRLQLPRTARREAGLSPPSRQCRPSSPLFLKKVKEGLRAVRDYLNGKNKTAECLYSRTFIYLSKGKEKTFFAGRLSRRTLSARLWCLRGPVALTACPRAALSVIWPSAVILKFTHVEARSRC